MEAYINNFTGKALEKHKSPEWLALIEKANAGTLTKAEEDKIAGTASVLTKTNGVVRLLGWAYNFQPKMQKFVVKTEYYLEETWGFNKRHAREAFKGLGKVVYIVEVPNPYK